MQNDNIIWAWDIDEKQFMPLIKSLDSFENPIQIIRIDFSFLQDEKEFKTHDDLIDELKKGFGDE